MDYFAENAKNNCSGFNLEDMLQNGTVMNGKAIHKPHSLLTATNIATQIITAVSSSQYGGVTISLTHLAPFVRDSYLRYIKKYTDRNLTREQIDQFSKEDLHKEIVDSVQLFNYQINTMFTVNGQAPFLSVFMYLGETEEYKKELAMLIEEFLIQRIDGMENQSNVKVTQEFPKLLYVLEEDNITEDSPYWYLTVLAAKCSAKRLTPDYISEKKMKEYKNGDVYWCMGCVDGESVIDYKVNGVRYVESFETAWDRLSNEYEVKLQDNSKDYYIDTDGVEIFDNVKNAYVMQYRIIRNTQSDWYRIRFSNGRTVDVTNDHPFEIINKGMVHAEDIVPGDQTYRLVTKNTVNAVELDNKAWLDGVLICDSSYSGSVTISLGKDEDDIKARISEALSNVYGLDTTTHVRDREEKGSYIDLYVKNGSQIHKQSISNFKGIRKDDRQIPDYIFNGTYDQKMSFMAGMIDADGYVNNSNNTVRVQIGSTNKKLATQQMMLAIDIGLNASIYENHYNGSDKIRYRVEFNCPKEFVSLLASKKKAYHFVDNHKFYSNIMINSNICTVSSIEAYHKTKYSYDVTTESEHFMFDGIYSHNCRSFLTPDRFTDAGIGNIAKAKNYVPGKHKYYGRFNQGVVTINLVDAALSSKGDEEEFWSLMDKRLELCHKALRCRHERLKGMLSDAAPILYQHGAFARLEHGEIIDELLYHGYSTISLGYAGLYECVKYMTGMSHSSGKGYEFGMKVMQKLNDACAKWKAEEDIDYSVYGTPIETATYTFAKKLKERFGIIEGITDHNYITNSYHINVREKIDPFEKLKIEAEFQRLSPGGAISYIECSDLTHNIPAVLKMIQFIYDNIMYAELNTKSDYCQNCGYDGEIKIIDDNGKLEWECPQCGCRDHAKMNVARRTCGYIGSHYWNEGRTEEIRDRYVHLDVHEAEEDEICKDQ